MLRYTSTYRNIHSTDSSTKRKLFQAKTAVVPFNVSLLIVIDLCLNYSLQLDLKHSQLRDFENEWTLPLLFANWHPYVHPNHSQVNYCFTITELTEMHKHFMHQISVNLFNLLKMWYQLKVNTDLKEHIYELSASFEKCPEYALSLFKFGLIILKHNIVFNREISMDLTWIDNKPILHIVDIETGLQNDLFIIGKSETFVTTSSTALNLSTKASLNYPTRWGNIFHVNWIRRKRFWSRNWTYI